MNANIPIDILKYKTKVAFNMTLRQLISIGFNLGVLVPSYIFLKNKGINKDILDWGMLILSVPAFAIGFFDYHGMNIEKFIYIYVRNKYVYPIKRKYKSDNKEMEEYINALNKEKEREEYQISKQSTKREKRLGVVWNKKD